jgi:hypothetical protein
MKVKLIDFKDLYRDGRAPINDFAVIFLNSFLMGSNFIDCARVGKRGTGASRCAMAKATLGIQYSCASASANCVNSGND